MPENRAAFLQTMIDILTQLHDTAVARGEPLLASVLAIARGEAEDSLRHSDELDAMIEMRMKTSIDAWRPGGPGTRRAA